MKFRRNARMLGNILDAAPIASVFFLIVIFVMLGPLIYTPGFHVELPVADNLPGTDQRTVTVAVDANNRLYFANQPINETELRRRLRVAVGHSRAPLTLIVQADKSVSWDYVAHLSLIARDAGIHKALLATLPRLVAAPAEGVPAQP